MEQQTVRKRSQRLKSLIGEKCVRCGKGGVRLHRHHRTMTETDFIILCVKCHQEEHKRLGTGAWTRKKQNQICVICGTSFIPLDSHKHKTCSPSCLSKIGLLNARKRWK